MILRRVGEWRTNKRKNSCSARHYDQIRSSFHTAWAQGARAVPLVPWPQNHPNISVRFPSIWAGCLVYGDPKEPSAGSTGYAIYPRTYRWRGVDTRERRDARQYRAGRISSACELDDRERSPANDSRLCQGAIRSPGEIGQSG